MQGGDFKLIRMQRLQSLDHRLNSRRCCVIGNFGQQRALPDGEGIRDRLGAFSRVEHKLHIAILDGVDNMRLSLQDLVDPCDFEAGLFQKATEVPIGLSGMLSVYARRAGKAIGK